jgi:exodeoxyribonuclease X
LSKGSEEEAIKEMIRISSLPTTIRTIRFGKYSGQKISDIVISDRGYLEWLLKQKKENPKDEEDWIFTLENALGIAHENIKMWN